MEDSNNSRRSISLEHPEVKGNLDKIFNMVLAESDRGAVLISTSFVDQYLEKLFENVMPTNCSKKMRKNLLGYPGPLSTLSAKTDIAYAMRLINSDIHKSIHILRSIRNEVAHRPEQFKLDDHKERLKEMYEIADGFAELVHVMSKILVFEGFAKRLLEEDQKKTPEERLFESKQPSDIYQELQNYPESLEVLQGKATRMELGLCVAWLCAFIVHSWELFQEKYQGNKLIL